MDEIKNIKVFLEKEAKKELGITEGITTIITFWEDSSYAIEIRHSNSFIHRFMYHSQNSGFLSYYKFSVSKLISTKEIDLDGKKLKSQLLSYKPLRKIPLKKE